MPEDDDSEFDLDLDLDLGAPSEPEAPVAPPKPQAQPTPAPIRKRVPDPAPAPPQSQPVAPKPVAPEPIASEPIPTQPRPAAPTPAPAQPRPAAPTPSPVPAARPQPTPAPPQQAAPTPAPSPQALQEQPTFPPAQPPAAQQPARPAPTPAAPAPEQKPPAAIPKQRSTPPAPKQAPQQEPDDLFGAPTKAEPAKRKRKERPRKPAEPRQQKKPRPQKKQRPKKEQRPPKERSSAPATSGSRKLLKYGIPIAILLVLGLLAYTVLSILIDRKRDKPKWNVEDVQKGKITTVGDVSDMPPLEKGEAEPAPTQAAPSNETPEERDERAENTLRNFFSSTKPEILIRYVRDPERVWPLMSDFYEREKFSFVDYEFLGLKTTLQEYTPVGPGFYVAEADLNSPKSHSMMLEDTPKGFRVDWEYFVRYNPMNWTTFVKEAPAPPSVGPMDFRVIARLVPDYRHPFNDKSQYLPVELTTFDNPNELIGYAVRDSELGRTLQEFLGEQTEQLCILKIEFPSGAKPGDSAVRILELVQPHWITTDEKPAE